MLHTCANAGDSIFSDGGGSDEGSGGGTHQKYGIILTTKDGGLGSTKTGARDDADEFDVMNNGILSLLGGSGGGLSVIELSEEANRQVSNLSKGLEELKGGIETGSESLEKSLETESPSTEINTKKSLSTQAKKVKMDTIFKMYEEPKCSGCATSDSADAAKQWKEYKKENPNSKKSPKTYNLKVKN